MTSVAVVKAGSNKKDVKEILFRLALVLTSVILYDFIFLFEN